MARRPKITRLEDHPNLPDILGVLAQLTHISDHDLHRLAGGWRNSATVATARDKALSPDSPLVIEVLSAFDAVAALFADDLAGTGDYVKTDPPVTTTALKAVRDAIAATYARPVLSRGEHNALLAPWRQVYPRPRASEPDLGPQAAQVKGLLGSLPTLARRCHDERGRRVYDGLLVTAMTLDEDAHEEAVRSAFRAAVMSGRRRVWTLVRRSAAEGLGRLCASCRRASRADGAYDDERVLGLCADAACALLVSDLLDDSTAARLTAPISMLVPLQRQGGSDPVAG
jgi:hypothetical protein